MFTKALFHTMLLVGTEKLNGLGMNIPAQGTRRIRVRACCVYSFPQANGWPEQPLIPLKILSQLKHYIPFTLKSISVVSPFLR